VDLERRVDLLDEADEPHVLHDDRVDPAVHGLAEEHQGVDELGRLDQNIEGQVDPNAAGVREIAGLLQLLERELGAIVPRVEALRAQVDGVRAVGHGRPDGVQRARGGE
jgi:hypothetical protein